MSPTTTAEETPSRWESFHQGGPPLVPSSTIRFFASVVSGARPTARPGAPEAAEAAETPEAVAEAAPPAEDAWLAGAQAVAASGVSPSAEARPSARRRDIPFDGTAL
ncbi:hypothetical protein GCM10011374_34300 [Kocuria dechangensis]|uniref:Uncharacterized protein n=1 Tax=Kocuria dechangensis TaxID=1176249 RepID=A0A917LZD1_9MICC|nr:hypothetical protein GCM10011374_34300 [Kocuria dechangensis]